MLLIPIIVVGIFLYFIYKSIVSPMDFAAFHVFIFAVLSALVFVYLEFTKVGISSKGIGLWLLVFLLTFNMGFSYFSYTALRNVWMFMESRSALAKLCQDEH